MENAAFLYAAIKILVEKVLLTIEKLDKLKKKIAEKLVEQFKQGGLGLVYLGPEIDKYSFAIESLEKKYEKA